MIPLDKRCTPHSLMALEHSNFVVFCANISVHFGAYDSNLTITLEQLRDLRMSDESDYRAVFITSGREIKLVSVTGNLVGYYTVNNYSPQFQPLPPNVNCLDTSVPILSPLNTKQAILLHCTTNTGKVAYVVPIPVQREVNAISIQAEGSVYSSLDDTYIFVVNEATMTIYPSTDSDVPGKSVRLSSKVTNMVNLNKENVRLLTENNREHIVMNVTSISVHFLPGGPPLLSQWVESTNHYIYLTDSNKIIVVNATLTESEYESEEIADEHDMMLFITSAAPVTIVSTMTATSTSLAPSPTSNLPPSHKDIDAVLIASSTLSVFITAIGAIVAVSTVAIILLRVRKKNKRVPHICKETGGGHSALHMEQVSNIYQRLCDTAEQGGMTDETDLNTGPSEPTPPPRPALVPTPPNNESQLYHEVHNGFPNLTAIISFNSSESDRASLMPPHQQEASSASSDQSDLPTIYPRPQQETIASPEAPQQDFN